MKKLIKKIKDTLSILSSSKGFTLLELLVVVLIIGILAGIALPQYQMAVGKSKFSTLKNLTHSLAGAAQRYYLLHDSYTGISVNKLDVEIPSDSGCGIDITSDGGNYLQCCKEIFSKNICYYANINTGKPLYCFVFSTDRNDKANTLCKKETGKQNVDGNSDSWNRYKY